GAGRGGGRGAAPADPGAGAGAPGLAGGPVRDRQHRRGGGDAGAGADPAAADLGRRPRPLPGQGQRPQPGAHRLRAQPYAPGGIRSPPLSPGLAPGAGSAGRFVRPGRFAQEPDFDLAAMLERHRVAVPVQCLAHRQADPTLADAVLLDVVALDAVEAHADAALEHGRVEMRAAWVDGQAVGWGIAHRCGLGTAWAGILCAGPVAAQPASGPPVAAAPSPFRRRGDDGPSGMSWTLRGRSGRSGPAVSRIYLPFRAWRRVGLALHSPCRGRTQAPPSTETTHRREPQKMATKKAAKKKAAPKAAKKAAAKKPVAVKPIKEVLSKSGLVAQISDTTGVAAKDVRAVMGALEAVAHASVSKKGA